MQAGKLNPQPTAKLNFPGFQEILDFTSAGSESSVSVTVDGDTDKEYLINVSQLNATYGVYLRLNADETSGNYGYQYLNNASGAITAARGTTSVIGLFYGNGVISASLLTPTGFIKTLLYHQLYGVSGTTVSNHWVRGTSYNSTSNITSLNFVSGTGNFTAGTRITVYARRSQT